MAPSAELGFASFVRPLKDSPPLFAINREQDRASLTSKIIALLVLLSMMILVGTI